MSINLFVLFGASAAVFILYVFTPIRFWWLSLDGMYKVEIFVNNKKLVATMENNLSSYAFKKIISKKPKTISMVDYQSMEKIGMLWRWLPANDRRIVTEPGDIILYLGRSIIIHSNSNFWNFTKLGHIENITQDELERILGTGNINMTFKLIE